MLKFLNGVIVDMTEEEEQAVKKAAEAYKKRELKRPLEQYEVVNLMIKKQVNSVDIDDQTSLRMKDYYPTFEEVLEMVAKETDEEKKKIRVGFKLMHEGELWKSRQAHIPQAIYPPSIDTAALYERINETNTGEIDDPIPYDETMKVYGGLYYTYNGVLYRCLRDSGQALFASPDEMLNDYFIICYA